MRCTSILPGKHIVRQCIKEEGHEGDHYSDYFLQWNDQDSMEMITTRMIEDLFPQKKRTIKWNSR